MSASAGRAGWLGLCRLAHERLFALAVARLGSRGLPQQALSPLRPACRSPHSPASFSLPARHGSHAQGSPSAYPALAASQPSFVSPASPSVTAPSPVCLSREHSRMYPVPTSPLYPPVYAAGSAQQSPSAPPMPADVRRELLARSSPAKGAGADSKVGGLVVAWLRLFAPAPACCACHARRVLCEEFPCARPCKLLPQGAPARRRTADRASPPKSERLWGGGDNTHRAAAAAAAASGGARAVFILPPAAGGGGLSASTGPPATISSWISPP